MTPTVADVLGVPYARIAALVSELAEHGHTVAAAESLTGGLLLAALTEVPGSSAVVRGGLVVYATDLKAELAGVDPQLLADFGPVHPEVARQLAAGARERCGATFGIGLTGVAGPDPQADQSVGTGYVAIAGPGGRIDHVALTERHRGPAVRARSAGVAGPGRPVLGPPDAGVRPRIRAAAVLAAIELLERTVDR